jgi:hypothetical protein
VTKRLNLSTLKNKIGYELRIRIYLSSLHTVFLFTKIFWSSFDITFFASRTCLCVCDSGQSIQH